MEEMPHNFMNLILPWDLQRSWAVNLHAHTHACAHTHTHTHKKKKNINSNKKNDIY